MDETQALRVNENLAYLGKEVSALKQSVNRLIELSNEQNQTLKAILEALQMEALRGRQ